MFLKLCVLPMMIKAVDTTRRPLLCSVIFALIWLTNSAIFSLAVAKDWTPILVVTGLNWLASLIFFAALTMFADTGLYWMVLILGTIGMLFFFN